MGQGLRESWRHRRDRLSEDPGGVVAGVGGAAQPTEDGGAEVHLELAGGVVAHNEEAHIQRALESLLAQDLPGGVRWGHIWVVASGCTDRTVDIARGVAAHDPRVSVLVEPERTGKARALREIFRRARGHAVVLLNSDAEAAPGAVVELLRSARGHSTPYAVMARPVVPPGTTGRWAQLLRLMWDLHHEFHLHLASEGGGAHLSDELLLVSLDPHPPLPEGIVNDGSYFGVWLAQNGGRRLYAPGAHVEIAIPTRLTDHLHQRRRIHFGNSQVTTALGRRPSTLAGHARSMPGAVVRVVQRSARRQTQGWRRFVALTALELAAATLSLWDRLPPPKDHVRWQRIRPPAPRTALRPPSRGRLSHNARGLTAPPLELRVATLVDVAARFGTGIALPDLISLLPPDGPFTPGDTRGWLEGHPGLARLDGDLVLAPRASTVGQDQRRTRGEASLRHALGLFNGPLRPTRNWVRCVSVTGSVAYGEPEQEDDLDLFVVVRKGALWWFLGYTYLALRLERWRRGRELEPVACFNFTIEDATAAEELTKRRDFLAARDALSAKPILGTSYYQGLLARCPWMATEIPRLYAVRARPSDDPDTLPAPILLRVANAVVYPFLATYLQLVGLWRSAHHRPNETGAFRTVTRFGHVAFVSRRFEVLRSQYGEGREPSEASTGVTYPSKLPSAR